MRIQPGTRAAGEIVCSTSSTFALFCCHSTHIYQWAPPTAHCSSEPQFDATIESSSPRANITESSAHSMCPNVWHMARDINALHCANIRGTKSTQLLQYAIADEVLNKGPLEDRIHI